MHGLLFRLPDTTPPACGGVVVICGEKWVEDFWLKYRIDNGVAAQSQQMHKMAILKPSGHSQ